MRNVGKLKDELLDIYSLLASGETGLAMKKSMDSLLYYTFLERKTPIERIEEIELTEILDKLLEMFELNKIVLSHDFFIDLIVVTLFRKSFLRRKYIDNNSNSRLFTLQVISILEFICRDTSIDNSDPTDEQYYVRAYENTLFTESSYHKSVLFSDEKSQMLVSVYAMYYSIQIQYANLTGEKFWSLDIDEFRFIDDEELNALLTVKGFIENPEDEKPYIKDAFAYSSSFDFEQFFLSKVMVNLNIEYVLGHLLNFKEGNLTIDKNIYTEAEQGKREATFHSVIYNALSMIISDDEFLLSELPLGDKRFDLYWYKEAKKLSAIIELKVNNLSNVDKDIKQVESYLNKKTSKIYLKEPEFGVLVTLNSGDKDIEYVKEKLKLKNISFDVIDDYFYIFNMSKPIILMVINDSSPRKDLEVGDLSANN